MEENLAEIVKFFDLGKIQKEKFLSGGIINATYFVDTDQGRFIAQKLHPMFTEQTIKDYQNIQKILRTNGLFVPVLIQNHRGEIAFKKQKALWRAFEYVQNETIDLLTPEIANEMGHFTARFSKILLNYDFKPKYSIPNFHDVDYFQNKLSDLMNSSNQTKKKQKLRPYTQVIFKNIDKYKISKDSNPSIIHGDPKKDNFLIQNNHVIGMLDLDTIMYAPLLYDLGDGLRSWAKIDYKYNEEIFKASFSGFNQVYNNKFQEKDAHNSMCLLVLMLAARFAIDVFEESYFSYDQTKFKSHAEHNLKRVANYISYYKDIIDKTS